MNNAKRGQIPPYNLFFLLYISRVIVTLTYVQSISVGIMASDLLISVAIAFVLTVVLSFPICFCIKKGISPISVKWIGWLYICFFVYKTAVNVARFSGFATGRLNPDATTYFFSIMIICAVAYGAYLGIEGLGRFSLFVGVSILGVIVLIIGLNADNFELINLFPIVQNSTSDIAYNSAIFTSNAVEPAVLLVLSGRVNSDYNKIKKAYFGSVVSAYLTIFVLIFFSLAVMGANSTLSSYPIFTLFQMATGESMARLDIIHTAFWILSAFLKCSLLIYCATVCIKQFSHKNKCIIISASALALSLCMTEWVTDLLIKISKPLSLATFVIFCVVIPLLSLFIIKKSKGDLLIEKF